MAFYFLFLFNAIAQKFPEPNQYWRDISFPIKSRPRSVIFGTHKMGYFKSTAWTVGKGNLTIHVLPPTFEEPVEFFITNQSIECIGTKQFALPHGASLNIKLQSTSNRLTSPFYLLNGYTPFEPADAKKPIGKSVIFVINRWGEVVWAYVTGVPPTDDHRTRTVFAKPISASELGLLHSYENSRFTVINTQGKTLSEFDPKNASPPSVYHHDFVWKAANTILTLSNSVKEFRKPWFFWRESMSFLGSPLLSVDLKEQRVEKVWDYIDHTNPFTDPDWNWNAVDSNSFWTSWGQPLVQNNFVHANSIDLNERGILLSLRNLNRLVLIDHSKKNLLWNIPSHNQFYRQHHATLMKNGNVLLFDNGKIQSRVIELKVASNGKSASTFRQFLPEGPIHSHRHGSAFQLENGNILAYFPSTLSTDTSPNRIIEFDYFSGKEKARLEYGFGYNPASYRAQPLESPLGAEPFKDPVPKCIN